MKQIQMKLTDEERTDAIYQPVCQNAATTAIADTLIKLDFVQNYSDWVVRKVVQRQSRRRGSSE